MPLGSGAALSLTCFFRRSFLAYLQRMPLSGWKRLNFRDENVGFTAEIRVMTWKRPLQGICMKWHPRSKYTISLHHKRNSVFVVVLFLFLPKQIWHLISPSFSLTALNARKYIGAQLVRWGRMERSTRDRQSLSRWEALKMFFSSPSNPLYRFQILWRRVLRAKLITALRDYV